MEKVDQFILNAFGISAFQAGTYSSVRSGNLQFQLDYIWKLKIRLYDGKLGFVSVGKTATGINGISLVEPFSMIYAKEEIFPISISYDPVFEEISRISLFSDFQATAYDGISYNLTVSTLSCMCSIAFGGPTSPPFDRVEIAAKEVFKLLAEKYEEANINVFASHWNRVE